MRVSVIGPVKNESQFIWASIMAVHPYVEEFIYAVAPSSDDGTIEILRYIEEKYGKIKLLMKPEYDFDPLDMAAYNKSFNDCLDQMDGDAAWFLHADMIVVNPVKIIDLKEGPLAWTVNMTSYARNFNTVITKGRCTQWKNLHANKFGLAYLGGYGSSNEDFYHTEITGKTLKHFGTEFSKYPFEVANSGININHYCELKPFKRRLEKMKLCIQNQYGTIDPGRLEEMALNHPRVSLEQSCSEFGEFEFTEADLKVPDVFSKYKAEFEPFLKELCHGEPVQSHA